jgi:Tfp pilus assembly protein PilN
MIEINLLPGSKRGGRRKGMPKLGNSPLNVTPKLPKFNRALALTVVSWSAGIALLAWMIVGGRMRKESLQSEIEAALLDSARLAEIIRTTDQLNLRMRSVAGKLNVVQEVDASRFVWPHILDEVARALPEHTWFVRLNNLPADSGVKYPKFSLEGRTGSNFALTKYLQQLEASPFIRQVRLKQSQLVRENDKLVYAFQLDADYETPPGDVIQTEPLFASNVDETAVPPVGSVAQAPTAPGQNAASRSARTTSANRPRTQEPR